ncbi:MAG: hypothetical protein AAGA56_13750 [Myxococcota bacterium]
MLMRRFWGAIVLAYAWSLAGEPLAEAREPLVALPQTAVAAESVVASEAPAALDVLGQTTAADDSVAAEVSVAPLPTKTVVMPDTSPVTVEQQPVLAEPFRDTPWPDPFRAWISSRPHDERRARPRCDPSLVDPPLRAG